MFNNLSPVNRHISIVPFFRSTKKDTQVLLPDDFEEEEIYIQARVLKVSSDCAGCFKKMKGSDPEPTIVIDRSMIEEVEVNGKKHYLILENYVLGILNQGPE